MTFRRLNAIAALLVAPVFTLYAQPIPPSTGTRPYDVVQGVQRDGLWSVTGNSIANPAEPVNTASGPFVVTGLPSGWHAAQAGTAWVGPAPDQTTATRPGGCCGGSVIYEVYFDVNTAPPAFSIFYYADDMASVYLNGFLIANATSPQFAVGATVQVTTAMILANQPAISGNRNTQQPNVLDFLVSNAGGGPTGLDVSFTSGSAPPSALGSSTAPGDGSTPAMPEPVDAASGQYYGTDSDIELGGPMNLGFRRYYSSQLSNGQVSTALGTNWMSNFDQRAVISPTTAQVLLFGGKIVSFANSGSAWQLVAPKDVLYQFIAIASGASYQFLDPTSSWIYSFTAAGALTSIADRNGNTVTVTQGANGPTLVSDGLGRTLTYTYTGSQLTSVTDQAARTESFTYSSGLLASVIDIYKQTTTYGYTTVGTATALQTHKQLPIGNIPLSQTFDSQGRVLTQRRVTGNNGTAYTTTMAYTANGGSSVTDAFGNVTRFGSSAGGNTTQLSDPTGATSTVTYDSSDRRTGVTDRVGNTISYTYDSQSNLLASVLDGAGNTTSRTYLAQPQGGFIFYPLTKVSYPDGTSISRTYDAQGNQLTGTTQSGAVTNYAYDAQGRLASITGPNQQTTSLTWNADSTLASATDALGNKQTYSYDSTKRITSAVDVNGNTTGYVWDKSNTGPMLAIVFPGTRESMTIYDDGNQQIQDIANSAGGVFHSDYTGTGQLADFIDPLKKQTTYAYDGDDRLSSVTMPAGEVYSYVYDSVNRITSVSDANGPRTSYTYTAESKMATAADGSGRKAAYTYDALGRLSTITTPGGNLYNTGYDKFGRVLNQTDPLGQNTTLTRDATGAILSATLPGPIATSLVRDASGNVTSLTTPSGNVWKIGRDGLERANKYTDPLGNSTTLSFTGAQLSGATLPLGTLALTHNVDGQVTQRKFSDGTAINTAYDSNRMLTAADGVTITRDIAGHPTNINGIGIVLDADGRPGTLTYAAGKTVTYAYDKGGRLTSVADWVGGKTLVGYDGAGRMTSLTYPNGVVTSYNYDTDGNLIGIAAGSLSSITLTRDAAGKITSANRNVPFTSALTASSQQYTYDAAGQLTSATNDAMGRVTKQNGRTYVWNLASQLTSFVDNTNSGTFTYDGLGEMSSSTASGATETFVYNYLLPLPALSIVRKANADLRYYVYFPNGTLLYSIEAVGNARHYYHFDEMGNTVVLSGDSGGSTDSYSITPYGETADHNGSAENPFTWQGQYGVIQEGLDLFYVRSRHYDASAARFISRDPIQSIDPRSVEPYAYAGGNPLRFIDPFGSNFTYPTAQSPMDSTHAHYFADDIAYNLTNYIESNEGLIDANQHSLILLADTILLHPDLDWQGWLQNLASLGIPIPGLAAYQAPVSTSAPITPQLLQATGPALGVPHCVTLDYCTVYTASGSVTGTLSSLVAQGLISQDGSSAVSHNGGLFAVSALIGSSGSTLIGAGGSTLIGNDGSSLIGNDGSSLLANQR